MAYIYYGDTEAAVVSILYGSTHLEGFTGLVVSSDLIDYQTGDTWLRVSRAGGLPTPWMALDNALINVDAYAQDKASAWDLANSAHAALFAAVGQYAGFGLSLYDVADHTGFGWAIEDGAAHYSFAVVLVTRPTS